MNKNPPSQLHKLLAKAGLASRRQANAWLEAGRIQVNGKVAPPWISVTGSEEVKLDGRILFLKKLLKQSPKILLYHKPEGEICTRSDPRGRATVFERLPKLENGRWVSVGRLDINSTGLLLFANDGDLAHRLMHPSSGLDKEYAVRVLGQVTEKMLSKMRTGVSIDGRLARFSDIQSADSGTGANHWYYVVLMEGRKREVRRLWESQGVLVSKLKRVRFGPILLPPSLRKGRWLELEETEVAVLLKFFGLKSHLKPNLKKVLRTSKMLIAYPGLGD